MLELNKIYNCDCRDGLKQLNNNSVDLTVCSPPYDSLRSYHDDEFAWNFDIFKEIADELYRVTKPGGVIVWVVGDEVVNGGETGTSFRQALYFQEIGFKIHDTMIYEKNSSTFPARINSKRYSQIFEYMFVFTKGKIRDDIKLIADKRNKWAGWTNWGTKTQYDQTGNLVSNKKNIKPTPEFSLRTNIWKYNVSFNDKTGHPAVFPEKLAEDHILSWTVEGDVVLDPFMGSGTTAKMAMLNNRNYIGFEKNTDYYEVSLKRVGKYEGKTNEWNDEIDYTDSEGVTDTLRVVSDDEKEEAKKIEIVNSLIEQLNEYYATMSSGILKTLKLTFQSKANDKRVVEVLKERGISGYTKDEPVKVVEKEPYKAQLCEFHNNIVETEVENGVKITPKKAEFKIKISEDKQQVNEDEKTPENALKNTIDEEIRNVLKELVGDTNEFIELIKYLKEEKIKDNKSVSICESEIRYGPEPIKRKRGRPKGSKNKMRVILDNPINFNEDGKNTKF